MIPKRPELLPEEKRPATQPTKPSRSKNRFRTVLWIVILLLLLSLGTLVSILVIQPQLIGLEPASALRLTDDSVLSTAAAIESTVISVGSTAEYLTTREAGQQNQSMNLQSTQAALDYRESLIRGQETEQFVNRISTQTAVAIQNSQQATQSALNFQATQQALQAVSTQVQLEFQATQTAISGGLWTPEPTAQPNILIVDEGIINRLETGAWDNVPVSSAWVVNSAGHLVAQTPNATLITRFPVPAANYTSQVTLSPVSANTHYDMVVGAKDNGQALGLRVFHNGTAITTVGFFTLESSTLGNGIVITETETVESLGGLNIEAQTVSIAIAVQGQSVTAIVNDRALLNSEVTGDLVTGKAALQVPSGTQVQRFIQTAQ